MIERGSKTPKPSMMKQYDGIDVFKHHKVVAKVEI